MVNVLPPILQPSLSICFFQLRGAARLFSKKGEGDNGYGKNKDWKFETFTIVERKRKIGREKVDHDILLRQMHSFPDR